jgi:hypothetical protein
MSNRETGQEINAARDAKIRTHQVRPRAHPNTTGKIADSPHQIEHVRKRKMMQSQNKSRYQTVRPGVKRSASAAS